MGKLPEITNTIEERTTALQAAKPLVAGSTFMSSPGADVMSLIRVAEYIVTGHDYLDTHPQFEEEPT